MFSIHATCFNVSRVVRRPTPQKTSAAADGSRPSTLQNRDIYTNYLQYFGVRIRLYFGFSWDPVVVRFTASSTATPILTAPKRDTNDQPSPSLLYLQQPGNLTLLMELLPLPMTKLGQMAGPVPLHPVVLLPPVTASANVIVK